MRLPGNGSGVFSLKGLSSLTLGKLGSELPAHPETRPAIAITANQRTGHTCANDRWVAPGAPDLAAVTPTAEAAMSAASFSRLGVILAARSLASRRIGSRPIPLPGLDRTGFLFVARRGGAA